MASLGGAFTGQDDEESPLRSIVSNSADALNKSLFDDPASRAALLQIGLNMMQPVGLGQTAGGHIASSLGAGGEYVTRRAKDEREAEELATKAAQKERELDIRQQEANAYKTGVETRGTESKAELERLRQQGRMQLQGARDYAGEAQRMWKFINDNPLFDTKRAPDYVKPYIGKSEDEIRQMLQKSPGTPSPASGAEGSGQPRTVRQGGFEYKIYPDGRVE